MQDYEKFLRLKRTPAYTWKGWTAHVPAEYEHFVVGTQAKRRFINYDPSDFLMDYQRDITKLAIRKEKFAVFAECGLGKTLIILEFARNALWTSGGRVLIVAPLMVCEQTIEEAKRFYGDDYPIDLVRAANLQEWIDSPGEAIGIVNYEAIREGLTQGNLTGIILDESSSLKSHYGRWGTRLIELGKGIRWKLACTGTPAPNDRIEYANHAVFLDHFRTTNEFLANYFVNKGQTQERWILKPHALKPFYRDLSHWCIFLSNPAIYGWKDNSQDIPPIHIHIDSVPLTPEQRHAVQDLTGCLMMKDAGGVCQRSKLMQISKGWFNGNPLPTNKPEYIRSLISSWPDESTIIWCHYNDEQDAMEKTFPGAASIQGKTPYESRKRLIDEFKSRVKRELISKPEVLGFGLNLQVASRQVFNGLTDSWEDFHQAVKRSNRIGSIRPLNVHIPVTEIEEPMVANVLRKADRIEADTREQEELFRSQAWDFQS